MAMKKQFLGLSWSYIHPTMRGLELLGEGVCLLAIFALTLKHHLCDVSYAVESGGLLCGRLAALVGSHGHGGGPDAPNLRLSALDKKVQFSRMMSPGVCYRGLKEL